MEARAGRCFPYRLRTLAERLADGALALLFPQFSSGKPCDTATARREIHEFMAGWEEAGEALASLGEPMPADAVDTLLDEMPKLRERLLLDARATFHGDPAARSIDEVIVAYPGFLAIALHRVANVLYRSEVPMFPRLIAVVAQTRTAIDIHPGATIGHGFMIDHGTGVVVGESATIGNGVKMYQGVTLGALAVEKALANRKRHPTIQDHVVIYANATILGGETVIGHDTVVGANAWVTESVPPFSVVGRNAEHRPRRSTGDGELEFFI